MSIPRFFCHGEIEMPSQGQSLSIGGAVAHHALKVLRLRVGDGLVLFNGLGGEYACTIENANGIKTMVVRVNEWDPVERESPLNIRLIQAISNSEKMDYVIQKSVEAGVASIQPITSERSVIRLDNERAEKRLEHWRSVVIASCEQCGRNRIPEIFSVKNFGDWLSQASNPETSLKLMMVPNGERGLTTFGRPAGAIEILIGPEGGFSLNEENLAITTGFQGVTLGPRILRTETAALVTIAAVQALWGDYS